MSRLWSYSPTCSNRQKKKEKVLATTWDDSDSEKEPNCDESDSEDENFINFTASLYSHDCYDKAADKKVESESQGANSERISNLQEAYDQLYQESTKWAGENYKQTKKLNLLINEKEKLFVELNAVLINVMLLKSL